MFVAAKDEYIVTPIKDSDSNSESVWAEITVPNGKNIKICSMYRPPKSGHEPVTSLTKVITELNSEDDSHIIVAGDFNCPGADWEQNLVRTGSPEMPAHDALLNFTTEHQMTQVQHEPSRGNNCLDLYFTTKPSLVKSVNTLPGISDHDIVVVDSDIKPTRVKTPPRKIYRYHKADWPSIKEATSSFASSFAELAPSRTVEENWNCFKEHMKTMQERFVPSLFTSQRKNLPYFNRRLGRMSRKKQKMYNTARRTGKDVHWAKYKRHQKLTDRAIRKAQWDYLNKTMLQALEEHNLKPFWKYVSSKKKDNIGTAPLKSHGKLHSDGQSKAEIFNRQFESVFNKDSSPTTMPTPSGPTFPEIGKGDLFVTVKGVENSYQI